MATFDKIIGFATCLRQWIRAEPTSGHVVMMAGQHLAGNLPGLFGVVFRLGLIVQSVQGVRVKSEISRTLFFAGGLAWMFRGTVLTEGPCCATWWATGSTPAIYTVYLGQDIILLCVTFSDVSPPFIWASSLIIHVLTEPSALKSSIGLHQGKLTETPHKVSLFSLDNNYDAWSFVKLVQDFLPTSLDVLCLFCVGGCVQSAAPHLCPPWGLGQPPSLLSQRTLTISAASKQLTLKHG